MHETVLECVELGTGHRNQPVRVDNGQDKECLRSRVVGAERLQLEGVLGPSRRHLARDDALGLFLEQGPQGRRHATRVLHVSLAQRRRAKVLLIHPQAWLLGLPTNPGARRWLAKQRANPPGCRKGIPIDEKD